MASLQFTAVTVNGQQLGAEVAAAIPLPTPASVAYADKIMVVSHPQLVAGNQAAVQTVINAHVPNPVWGLTVRPYIFVINGAAPLLWTNQPSALTEVPGSRTRLPLYDCTAARLTAHVMVAGVAGATLTAQFSLDQSAWVSGPSVSLTNTGLIVSSLTVISPQYRTDVFFRLAGAGGNATADPQFGLITVQVA